MAPGGRADRGGGRPILGEGRGGGRRLLKKGRRWFLREGRGAGRQLLHGDGRAGVCMYQECNKFVRFTDCL